MEGFAPFCLVYCFVVIQLYHKIERISSFFALFFVVWLVLDLWITLEVQYTETQESTRALHFSPEDSIIALYVFLFSVSRAAQLLQASGCRLYAALLFFRE